MPWSLQLRPYGPPGVLVSHPARQHSWATARALQRANLLQAFVTSIDYDPARFPYRLLRLLPTRLRDMALAELGKRAVRLDDRSAVHSAGLWPFVLAAGRLVATDESSRIRLNRMTEVVFDRWVSGELPRVSPLAVHCFEDAAVRTFTRAKQLGIPRVLDVASDHTGYVRLLQEEARLLRASGVAVRSAEEEKIHTDIYTERDLADYLLVPAEHVRQALQADGVPDRKIVTIPFGVDTGLFIPTATRRPPGARFTVLFVGLLNMRKGVQYLLDAWKGLGLDDAELVIVGGGDDRAIASLRATAGRNVRWVGNVPHSMVLEYYHNADVFVFPSLFESFGLVVAEAMACALPVVTTPTAGSIVRDGIDGYIVPPRDVDALKEKIATLYHDRILCRRIGQNARERVVGSYTWKHYEQRLAAFYREVVLGDTVDMVPQPEMRDRVTSGRKCEG